ncbi:unnamed protein product [Clonostachys rosea]|uniref:O-methylsterigmatocystin oxidoreductase n=1 Tax=Bionectria ochroleuca TaxID=29856 RepID=A0ABY6UXR1_BIOOC|nr:unnamed protein product [Clonostachys rosea]
MALYSTALTCFLMVLVLRLLFRRIAGVRLPPAPKPWPLIGNITDLPPRGVPEYQHWLKHKDQLGILSSVRVLGQTILVIHDRDAAAELLEKRSKKTSGRPDMEFANQLCGYYRYFSTRQYDDVYRKNRRFAHQEIGTKKLAERYHGVQTAEVGHFLSNVLDEPAKLMEHLKSESGAVILKVAYGYAIQREKVDPLVLLIERMMHNFSIATVPGAWLVDFVPALKYLPDWFPGAAFKKKAREAEQINHLSVEIPYCFARRQMDHGNYQPSYVSELVQSCINTDPDRVLSPLNEDVIKNSAGALYGGGADTTVASLSSFVLAMLKFPGIQRRIQEEIDAVTGGTRLPQFEDRPGLPYIEATVKETLRWFAIAPMGLPHTSDEDMEFRGYHIPKNTILLPAIWWFLHDPDVYKDPDSFDPTRYLPPRNEPDPGAFAFGFGRRVCPGKHIADSTLFLTIAQLLAVFNIEKALDSDGTPIDPAVESLAGLINRPKSFPYIVVPRSEAHVDLIRRNEIAHPWQQSNTDDLGDLQSMLQVLGKLQSDAEA